MASISISTMREIVEFQHDKVRSSVAEIEALKIGAPGSMVAEMTTAGVAVKNAESLAGNALATAREAYAAIQLTVARLSALDQILAAASAAKHRALARGKAGFVIN